MSDDIIMEKESQTAGAAQAASAQKAPKAAGGKSSAEGTTFKPPKTNFKSFVLTSQSQARASGTRRKTRIQKAKTKTILDAALINFVKYGLDGATVDAIADTAGMSKPNLLYYFRTKEDIYLELLNRTLEGWLEPLGQLTKDDEPIPALTSYIKAKLDYSLQNENESKLFAGEILRGAPIAKKILEGPLKDMVDYKVSIINHWIEKGKIRDIDPHHLIFMMWACTQHYADFSVQIKALLPKREQQKSIPKNAKETLVNVLINGLRPD